MRLSIIALLFVTGCPEDSPATGPCVNGAPGLQVALAVPCDPSSSEGCAILWQEHGHVYATIGENEVRVRVAPSVFDDAGQATVRLDMPAGSGPGTVAFLAWGPGTVSYVGETSFVADADRCVEVTLEAHTEEQID
jgi:hypothetical protein